jgi:hypothetical protein
MADGDVVQYEPPDGWSPTGHNYIDFVSATKHADGTYTIKYDNGDTTSYGTPVVAKPDPNWRPDTSGANSDAWNSTKGTDPPFTAPPAIPGGPETPGKGVTVISVDAIKLYATNIEALLPTITSTLAELDDLSASGFGAGYFGAANNFKGKVFGGANSANTATLLASTRTVFTEAESIIKSIALRCREIAQKYKTADELTKLDAEEFGHMVSTVKTKVDALPLGAAG